MARLWSSGFELNSAGVGVTGLEWSSQNSGSLGSIQTSLARSGTYAARFTSFSSTTGQSMSYQFASALSAGPYFLRGYFNFATFPGSSGFFFGLATAASSSTILGMQITSGGVVSLVNAGGTNYGSSSALSTGVWYRLEIKLDRTGGAGATVVEGLIDGSSFATSSTATLANGVDFIQIGRVSPPSSSAIGDFYVDDIAINDSTGSFQNAYPGDGRIIHLRPSATGDNTTWTPDTGSNFARVQEVSPDSDTSYVRNSVTLNQADDYNVDDSGINSYDVVNLVSVGFYARAETATTNDYQFTVRVKKAASGTVSESSSINIASTTYLINASALPRNYPLVLYQDPDSANWTQTTLDSMQIGLKTSVTSTNRVRVSTEWALVDYTTGTPPAGGASYSTMSMMGIG